MIKKSILIWLLIIPLAILNGILRESVLIPFIGIKYALPISGIILCSFIFVVSLIFIPKLGRGINKTYWVIGGLWIILTILFETIMGLASGNNLSDLMKAYDITSGDLWLLIVIFVGIAPWLTAKIKRII